MALRTFFGRFLVFPPTSKLLCLELVGLSTLRCLYCSWVNAFRPDIELVVGFAKLPDVPLFGEAFIAVVPANPTSLSDFSVWVEVKVHLFVLKKPLGALQ